MRGGPKRSVFENLKRLVPTGRTALVHSAEIGVASLYGLSAFLTLVLLILIVSPPSSGPFSGNGLVVKVLGWGNLILCLGLAYRYGRRIWNEAQDQISNAAGRLHQRFVLMFGAAAGIPALLILAVFAFMMNRGVENWFAGRVRTAVENSAGIAQTYFDDRIRVTTDAFKKIAQDVEDPKVKYYFPARIYYNLTLGEIVHLRGDALDAVYLVDAHGNMVAAYEGTRAPDFLAIHPNKLADLNRENVLPVKVFNNPDAIRLYQTLPGYPGLYLYGVRSLEDGTLKRLTESYHAIKLYREGASERASVQTLFGLAYLQVVLLIIIFAVFVGRKIADRIASPVAGLVDAVDSAARGDLSVRVDPSDQFEEIAVLSRAFNRMTTDLETQREALLQAKLETEQRSQFTQAVLSGVSAGVIGLDSKAQISSINDSAVKLLDLSPDAILGQPLIDFAPELYELLSERGQDHEIDVVRKGETRRLRVRTSLMETGTLVLTFDDISRLVAAQRNAAWKDVARRIAHEIKNPLTPIQLSAERIKRKYRAKITEDLETFDRCTDTIIRQVGDIGRMVDEFSSFARMPAPRFANEDLCEVLKAAVFAQRVANPHIDYQLELECDPLFLSCDRAMLNQALTNVLKNAGEAILTRQKNQPDLPPRILVRLKQGLEHWDIEIEDDGIGLPEKDRSKLVEPYVTHREKGTGLGLAIVKRICEDHGGGLSLADATTLLGAKITLSLAHTPSLLEPARSELAS